MVVTNNHVEKKSVNYDGTGFLKSVSNRHIFQRTCKILISLEN